MVARLSEMPVPWFQDRDRAPGASLVAGSHGYQPLALRGQLLLERASGLADVRTGGRGFPGFNGVALHLADSVCHTVADCFLRNRIFAVIADDGSMCLRLPPEIADDLIENGLCMRAGKNLLTWPLENEHQLEVSWRMLLHAYWNITSTSEKRARRMWSEWVIQH